MILSMNQCQVSAYELDPGFTFYVDVTLTFSHMKMNYGSEISKEDIYFRASFGIYGTQQSKYALNYIDPPEYKLLEHNDWYYSGGGGEQFFKVTYYNIPITTDKVMSIEVWDYDQNSSDDLLYKGNLLLKVPPMFVPHTKTYDMIYGSGYWAWSPYGYYFQFGDSTTNSYLMFTYSGTYGSSPSWVSNIIYLNASLAYHN